MGWASEYVPFQRRLHLAGRASRCCSVWEPSFRLFLPLYIKYVLGGVVVVSRDRDRQRNNSVAGWYEPRRGTDEVCWSPYGIGSLSRYLESDDQTGSVMKVRSMSACGGFSEGFGLLLLELDRGWAGPSFAKHFTSANSEYINCSGFSPAFEHIYIWVDGYKKLVHTRHLLVMRFYCTQIDGLPSSMPNVTRQDRKAITLTAPCTRLKINGPSCAAPSNGLVLTETTSNTSKFHCHSYTANTSTLAMSPKLTNLSLVLQNCSLRSCQISK